jgi:thymidylate synthase
MKQYLELLRAILAEGYDTGDRTGVGTRALPGYSYQMKLSMDDDGIVHNYPLLTTKKVFLRGTFEELMWKLNGETNILRLLQKDVHIWTEWPFKKWLEHTGQINKFDWYVDEQKSDYSEEWKQLMKSFETMILIDPEFAKEWGDLGPTYGHHVRNFGELKGSDINIPNIDEGSIVLPGIDQLKSVIDKIMYKPEDRRIIMSLWNPHDNPKTLLPPCPCFYQFFANQPGYLHMNVYQRSCDSFLGVPFNDSQDALLLILLAKVTGRKPGIFNHYFGDVHIYNNHRDQVELQLTREPRPLPSIRINRETENILDFKWEDIERIGYDPYPEIKAPVAV